MRYALLLTFVIQAMQISHARPGDNALDNGASTLFASECANKNANSCYGLANTLLSQIRNEERVRTKPEAMRIFKHYKLACDYGSSDGCYAVAKAYSGKLKIIDHDQIKSVNYFSKACEADHVRACDDLASHYSVKKDHSRAIEYYAKGCELNDAYSCMNLSHAYKASRGVERDIKKSVKYQAKGCELGFRQTCPELAKYHYDGKYVKQSQAKAISYYERGCRDIESHKCAAVEEYISGKDNSGKNSSIRKSKQQTTANLTSAVFCSETYTPSGYGDTCEPSSGQPLTGRLFFSARGDNFISVKPDSLIIDEFKIDDTDARQTSNGGKNIRLDQPSNHSSTAEENYLSWGMTVQQGLGVSNSPIELKGSILALSSQSITERKSKTFNISDFKSFKLGPVQFQGTENRKLRVGLTHVAKQLGNVSDTTITTLQTLIESLGISINEFRVDVTQTDIELLDISQQEKEAVHKLKGAYELWQPRWTTISGLDKRHNNFFLHIESGASLVKKVILLQSNKEFDVSTSERAFASESDDNEATHYFSIPDNEEVTIKVVYWDKPELIKINFAIEP